ncbi:MAG: hypothetical protein OXU61_07290 [Gammaproteobacteria bacterium]|nr:hypothetical protein [Gammaproteobacteria bacterium]
MRSISFRDFSMQVGFQHLAKPLSIKLDGRMDCILNARQAVANLGRRRIGSLT